jgi:hypothetical protein
MATVLVGGGLGLYCHHLSQRSWPSRYRDNEDRLLQIYDFIAAQSRQRGLTEPRIAVDHISDSLYPHVMRPVIYERQGLLLKPRDLRGAMVPTLLVVSEREALACLHQCDFAIVTTGTSYPESQLYPFERSIQQLRPRLTRVCETYFRPVGRFSIYGRDVTVYMRPTVTGCDDAGGNERECAPSAPRRKTSRLDYAYLKHLETPYGVEEVEGQPFFWMGQGATTLQVMSSRAGFLTVGGRFLPGPSLPGRYVRHVRVQTNAGFDRTVTLDAAEQSFAVPVAAGISTITLTAVDSPTLAPLSNGDRRWLLVGVRELWIKLQQPPAQTD